ncbi:MAG: hypothetical protein AAF633_08230 [Chloroflexota bacterium]
MYTEIALNPTASFPQTPAELAEAAAKKLFEIHSKTPLINKIKTLLGQGENELEHIGELVGNEAAQTHLGQQQVSLSQICGSVSGRCKDFDKGFRPLNRQTEARWVSIAKARRLGKRLPPVKLLLIGDKYFIEDGHHRISVSAACGDKLIDATVTTYAA